MPFSTPPFQICDVTEPLLLHAEKVPFEFIMGYHVRPAYLLHYNALYLKPPCLALMCLTTGVLQNNGQ